MITVTNDFKTAVRQPTKEMKAYLTDGVDEITESDDLQSIKITGVSSMCRSVMRQAEVTYLGSHDYLESYVNLGIGVVLADTTTEYIDYGKFKIVSVESNLANNTVKAKMFDKMYEALQQYDLEPIYDLVFPCTLKELLEAICTRFSWTLGTTTFPNQDFVINTDVITGLGMSFRDVLDDIAEASASIIYFDVNDELKLRQITDTVNDSIGVDELVALKVEEGYGPINSVVLSRMPQQDNIVQQDADSISTNGLTEFKIINNVLLDSSRTLAIDDIFTALDNISFNPAKTETTGLGYYQIGDRIEVTDLTASTYETLVLEFTIEVGPGFRETLDSKIPDKTNTPYQYAGVIGGVIRDTQIIVNKQTGEITLLTSQTEENTENITQLTQTVEGLSLAVESVGGTNMLRNSVGLKGTLTEWQEFDENGDLTDVRNNATLDQSASVEQNTESSSAFELNDQFITQSIPTIIGETYTFYCRFKRDIDLFLSIGGVAEDIEIDTTSYINDSWSAFRYQFVATLNTTSIRLETVGSYATVSDIIVKLGEVAGWSQAPNEVYGQNYKFDRDGFQITSPNNNFRSLLDNEKLAVYDDLSGVVLMQVSREGGLLTNVVVQNYLQVQRYNNTSKCLKIIPTSTGALFVIND